MPWSYDKDTQQWVKDTIGWYLNKEVFINDTCKTLTAGGMVLNVRIKNDLPLNNRLIPDNFNETDESYNLYITS